MPADIPHALQAKEGFKMLLMIIRSHQSVVCRAGSVLLMITEPGMSCSPRSFYFETVLMPTNIWGFRLTVACRLNMLVFL